MRISLLFIGIDVGGTFTDIVSYSDKTAALNVTKVLTTPSSIEQGVLNGLSDYMQDPSEVGLISHATTVATNALLTHSDLLRTALMTNRGFRDVLEIGRQRRSELYDLDNKRPVPLVRRRDRFTVGGRILADGTVSEPISTKELEKVAEKILFGGYDSVVIGFLNSYVNLEHEKLAVVTLQRKGFNGHIEASSEVNREYREFERFSTAVVNASIVPLVSRYLANLRNRLRLERFMAPIYVMNSDGSVSTIDQASKYPVLMIESGPAAGVLASKHIATSLSLRKILTFDMGGTTAKAGAVVDFEPDVSYEFEAAGISHSGRSIKGSGYAVRAPFIDLAEVSAGGGTIAFVDEGGSIKVGPRSAGSEPGPAAYGRGGRLPTVTDANVVLGRINPDHLLGGKMKIFSEFARDSLKKEIAEKTKLTVEESAQGILNIVNNQMARAISIVSVERGRDPRDYTMIAFGGAGPLHACDLAEELEISSVVIPEHAGLFSAYGLLSGDLERKFELPILKVSTSVNLLETFAELRKIAKDALAREENIGSHLRFIESVEARYAGQSYGILIPFSEKNGPRSVEREFNLRHKRLYGYNAHDQIELVNAKLRVLVPINKPKLVARKRKKRSEHTSSRQTTSSSDNPRRAWFGNGYHLALVYEREKLEPGADGHGPCIFEEYDSTAIINPAWSWKVDEYGNLIVRRTHAVRKHL